MIKSKINTYPKTPDSDSIIVELWRAAGQAETFASTAVADAFGEYPHLSPGQREMIVTTFYGMLRNARRIHHALCPDGRRLPRRTSKALAELFAYRVLEKRISLEKAHAKIPEIDWKAVAAADESLSAEPDAVKRIAIGASLPDFLAQRLFEQYGGEAEALARALNQPAPLAVRANTLKVTREELLAELAECGLEAHATELSANGIELAEHSNVFALEFFKQGHLEIQDEASQIIADLVAPPPKGLVIDFCAGAGGKTLALGALMRNKGRLIALDVNARRLEEFQRRARRAGHSQRAGDHAGKKWTPELQRLLGKADRVLVDVPCSGVGAFRRKPEMRWRLTSRPDHRTVAARTGVDLAPRDGTARARRPVDLCDVYRGEGRERSRHREPAQGYEFPSACRSREVLGGAKAAKVCEPSRHFPETASAAAPLRRIFAAILRRKRK